MRGSERADIFAVLQFHLSNLSFWIKSVQLKHLFLGMNNLLIISRSVTTFPRNLFFQIRKDSSFSALLFAVISFNYLLSYFFQISWKYLSNISTKSSPFRNLKKYIKTASCYPELCERRDYRTIMNDFHDSEKVNFFTIKINVSEKICLNIKGAFADAGWWGKSSNCPPLLYEGGPGSLQQQVLAPGLLGTKATEVLVLEWDSDLGSFEQDSKPRHLSLSRKNPGFHKTCHHHHSMWPKVHLPTFSCVISYSSVLVLNVILS